MVFCHLSMFLREENTEGTVSRGGSLRPFSIAIQPWPAVFPTQTTQPRLGNLHVSVLED